MNNLSGKISGFEQSGNLALVTIALSSNTFFKAIVIETLETAPHLYIGQNIQFQFKETEVIIGLNHDHFTSIENNVSGKMLSIK